MRHITLARQLGYSTASMAVNMLLTPLLILLLTRNMPVESYGIYVLLSTFVALGSIVLELAVSQYLTTKMPGKGEEKLKHLSSILVFFALLSAVMLLFAVIPQLTKVLAAMLSLSGYEAELSLAVIVLSAAIIWRVVNAFLAANKRMEAKSSLDLVPTIALVGGVALALAFGVIITIPLALSFWLAGHIMAIGLALGLLIARKEFRFMRPSWRYVKEGLGFSIHLVPGIVASMVINLIGRYFINAYHGPVVVAYFSLAYALASLVNTLGTSVSIIFYPHIAEDVNMKKESRLLSAAMKYGLMIILPGMAILIAMGKGLITLISGPAFLEAYSAVPILAFFPLFWFLAYLYGQTLLLNNKPRAFGYYYVAAAAVNIGLNFLLIPGKGMIGAAWATVISYVFMLGIALVLWRKNLSWDFSYLRLERVALASLAIGLLLWALNPWTAVAKILSLLLAGIVYAGLILLLRVFSKDELALARSLIANAFK
ncbi:MAG: polysaccharide biosynthesis C-terminal domain-containing protein [Nanoarchaeota archaeon]